MPRFFVKPEQINEDRILLTGTDVNHIKNVLRMKTGDKLSVCDGNGTDYECEISSLDREEITLDIISSCACSTELTKKLYLFQGLPKSDKMELIIQKAVELGVYKIIPVQTSRCIAKLEPKKEEKKIARWQQISESAAKQSGRGIIPEICKPMNLRDALELAGTLDAAMIPYEKAEGIEKTRELIKELSNKDSVGIFIGPEGGFAEDEILMAEERSVHPITLGKRILRTETAGMAILSVLMMEFEN